MLKLDDVTVNLNDFQLRANLSVPVGARVGVIGPSGAGKSTLLAFVGGFHNGAGNLSWNGEDIGRLSPADRPVSMLFQDHNLFPHLSAAQNVALGFGRGLRVPADLREGVVNALDAVGLKEFADRKPGELSGGQQSRVALARVLLQDRPIMLLDEPFSALGPAQRGEMLDLLANLLDRTGATMMMVSHDPDDIRCIADLSVLVADGQAAEPVETAELLDNPPPSLAAYLGK